MLGLLLAVACDDHVIGLEEGGSGGSGPGPGGDSGPVATGDVSYYKDVYPILQTHCVACHAPGEIAPFSLLTYDDAKPQAGAIFGATSANIMPPWPPDPACNSYQHERSLTDDEKAVLKAWSDAGAPEGDPADQPDVDPPAPGMSRVDITLPMPEAYTPTVAPDDYRCFLIDPGLPQTMYVTGFGVEPDQPSIDHHVIAYLAPPDQVATYQALDDADPGVGWSCFGGPGGDTNLKWLGAWVPGSTGADYPAGTGIKVEAGSAMVLQMHYNTSFSPAVADQTKVDLEGATSVDKEAQIVTWVNPDWTQGNMDIPAGDPDVVHAWDGDNPLGTTVQVWAAGLHMHLLGTSASLTVHHSDGSDECLLEIPQWDFHWQGTYFLDQPITIGPNDSIEIECHWNNAAGTTDVNWGEGSTDEMCVGLLYGTMGG